MPVRILHTCPAPIELRPKAREHVLEKVQQKARFLMALRRAFYDPSTSAQFITAGCPKYPLHVIAFSA